MGFKSSVGKSLAIGSVALLTCGVAHADPIEVGITAFWSVVFQGSYAGLSISGGEQETVSSTDSQGGFTTTKTGSSSAGISNNGTSAFTGNVDFIYEYTAFNSGSYGISISDPTTQFASFSSLLTGSGFSDSHACSIGVGAIAPPFGQYNDTGTRCSVVAPDTSEFETGIFVNDLLPGQSIGINGADISISVTFDIPGATVPEPASILLLTPAFFAFAFLRRRTISVGKHAA